MYTVGVAVLLVTSIPAVFHHGAGLPGLLVALITISAALGGTKASLPPLLGPLPKTSTLQYKKIYTNSFTAEQCEQVPRRVKTTKKGEKVIEDPDVTLQYLFDIFYW